MKSIKLPLKQVKKSWDKMPDETNLSYSFFIKYLEMGPQRSLLKLCQKYTKKPNYVSQLKNWSTKYNWVMRAEEYDEKMILEALSNKKRIVNIVMGELLNEARKAVRTIVEVMDMPNHTFGTGVKGNAKERLQAAEMVLNRIGVIEETEKTVEKTKPMSIYDEIRQHFYGDDESKNSDEY